MSTDGRVYLEEFPAWLRSLADDAVAMAAALSAESMTDASRRCIVGGLNYLFKSLDLVPDGIEDIGYLDDAFVLRLSAKEALRDSAAKFSDDTAAVLGRLAACVATIESFLGDDFSRLASYVKDLGNHSVRGRSVQAIVSDAAVEKAFLADVEAFARAFQVPSFQCDERTLIKLRAFLSSRLPTGK
ncbi:MAG: hypothetical protein NVS3B20_22540 [Polyangiales bacterium]